MQQLPGYNHWWTTGIAVWTDFMVLKSLPRCLLCSCIDFSRGALWSKTMARFCWMMSFGYPFSGGEAAAQYSINHMF